MKTILKWAFLVLLLMVALAGGYRLGQQAGGAQPSAAATGERKPLYYRNPMGLSDTSPVPKKDSMGMDYIPVYAEDEKPAAGQVGTAVSTDKIQKTGVKLETVGLRRLDRVLRAAGRIEVDERRIHTVAPKFEGWIEQLHVAATGQPVSKGQVLFEVYSPELFSAQREYLIAREGMGRVDKGAEDIRLSMQRLADSALLRLKNWDISPEQLSALEKSGEAKRTLSFRSPAAGVVTEKKALPGMRFQPGETLYQIVDVSSVWLLADVAEQDVAWVRPGMKAVARLEAYPGKVFEGRVDYLYPTLKAETRSVPVRIVLPNPGGLLKPAMYAHVELVADTTDALPAVPISAVMDSGTRQVVLVQSGEGRFAARTVQLGRRGEDYVAVLSGVQEGEKVVVNGNFLIDAESKFTAALSGLGTAAGESAAAPKTVSHQANGTLDAVDAKAGTVTVTHQPIPSLKWPAMTMDFVLAHPGLITGVRPGAHITIEIVERQPGEWVITALKPREAKP